MGYYGTHWGSSYLLVFKVAITGTVIYDKLRVKSLTRWLGNVGNTDHSATSLNFRDKTFQRLIVNLKTKPIVYHVILQNVHALWLYQQYRVWGHALFKLHFMLHVHRFFRHRYRSRSHSVKGKALGGDKVTLTNGLELCPSSTFSF